MYIMVLSSSMFVYRRDHFAQSSHRHGQRQRPECHASLRRNAQSAGRAVLRARAFRAPHAGGSAFFRAERARGRLWRHHRRRGQGRASGRGHGSQHHAAGHRRTHQVLDAGRAGRAFVHRADAAGNAGGHRGHRRGENAALLAAQIIAVEDSELAERLMADREATKAKILAKDAQISAEFAQE